MKLSSPKVITWWVAVLLGVIGLAIYFIPAFNVFAFWLVLVGFLLLALATAIKGL